MGQATAGFDTGNQITQSGNLKDLSTSFYHPTHDVTRVLFGDTGHPFLLNQVHPLFHETLHLTFQNSHCISSPDSSGILKTAVQNECEHNNERCPYRRQFFKKGNIRMRSYCPPCEALGFHTTPPPLPVRMAQARGKVLLLTSEHYTVLSLSTLQSFALHCPDIHSY